MLYKIAINSRVVSLSCAVFGRQQWTLYCINLLVVLSGMQNMLLEQIQRLSHIRVFLVQEC